VHQQTPAIRRGRDFIHEQFIQAVILMSIGQGEVQCSLNLTAKLLCLALSLTTLRQAGAPTPANRLREIPIDE
jgi:hypothetical protein